MHCLQAQWCFVWKLFYCEYLPGLIFLIFWSCWTYRLLSAPGWTGWWLSHPAAGRWRCLHLLWSVTPWSSQSHQCSCQSSSCISRTRENICTKSQSWWTLCGYTLQIYYKLLMFLRFGHWPPLEKEHFHWRRIRLCRLLTFCPPAARSELCPFPSAPQPVLTSEE